MLADLSPSGIFHNAEDLSPASGIAVDAGGRIFVSDEFNHRICVYNPDLSLAATIGRHGEGEGEFRYPRGIAIGPDGNLYVADAWNHRVAVIGPDLAIRRTIGGLGGGMGRLDEPCGIAFANGLLAVLEKSNHRVQLFTLEGEPVRLIGRRGGADEQVQFYASPPQPEAFVPPVFEYPSAIAAGADGSLYVADTNNHRVVKLGPDGSCQSAFTTPGLRYPVGISCDAAGNLHCTQFNREGVLVISPEGVSLYRYLPEGVSIPVAAAASKNMVYVGAGMKAAIARLTFNAVHDAGCAVDAPFPFYLKTGIAAFAAGDAVAAFERFGAAAEAGLPPLEELAALLPEGGFGDLAAAAAHPKAEAFCALLDDAALRQWDALETALAAKLAAVDENTTAVLQLEKNLLLGSGDADAALVARWRSIKKILNGAADVKRAASAYRKISAARRSLAEAGQALAARLKNLAARRAAVAAWRAKREMWFAESAAESAALNFNSMPDERAPFARNENRLTQMAFECRLLWGFAADAHFEIAAHARNGAVTRAQAAEWLLPAIDLLIDAPEEPLARLNFLNSVEALMEGAGDEASRIAAAAPTHMWELLGREDNINPHAQRGVYPLLGALWGGHAPALSIAEGSWEKIVSFYHGEFTKFTAESAPLRAELLRNALLLPLAEKSDPKQAALVMRKISLLGYHLQFQERYIAAMMLEYLVRFARFAGAAAPESPAVLDKFITDAAVARAAELEAVAQAHETLTGSADQGRKQDVKIRQAAATAAGNYLALLEAHLALARRALAVAPSFRPATTLFESAAGHLPMTQVCAARFDKVGNLYVVTRNAVSVYDARLRPLRTIAEPGHGRGAVDLPMDVAFTAGGGLLISQMRAPSIAEFESDGRHRRDIPLEGASGRVVYRIAADGEGKIYTSFMDGNGLNIYSSEGKLQKTIAAQGGAFERLDGVRGFALLDGLIYAAGNGVVAAVDAVSGEVRKFVETGLSFDAVNDLTSDGAGTIYFISYRANTAFVADAALTGARQLPALGVAVAGGIGAAPGRLAVCDYAANRVRLLNASAP